MPSVGFTVNDQEVEELTQKRTMTKFGPGNYKFVITDAELGASSVKGTPRIEVKLLVEFDGKEFKMFDDVYLTENSKWRFVQFCKGLGLDPTADVDTDDMPGKEGVLRTKLPEGEKYVKVGEYYAPEMHEFEPLGPFEETSKLPPSVSSIHGDDSTPF